MNPFASFFFNVAILFFLLLPAYQAIGQSFEKIQLGKEPFQSNATVLQDYDGDGDLDIVASRSEPRGIYVLTNDDTKQFLARPIITDDLTHYIADLDTADLDNDGDLDYIVSMTDVLDGELSWFQRQANDTYIKWTIASGRDYLEAKVADFNADGWLDIATVGLINSNQSCILYLNQGNLFFTEKVIQDRNVGASIDAGDLDNDGDMDLAITAIGFVDFQADTASGSRTLINDGNGNFSVGHYLNSTAGFSTSHWETIKIVDLNQDGVQDILAFSSNGLGPGLHFYDGNNMGQYNDLEGIFLDDDNGSFGSAGDMVVFDVDDNGLLDIVRQSDREERVAVLYQTDHLVFERTYIELHWDNCCNPTAKMAVGDIDNDGDLDVVFPEKGNVDEDISWFENINGELYRHYISGRLHAAQVPKMADVDNDGDLDILLTLATKVAEENEVLLFENMDGENFINWRIHDNMNHATDIEMVDIDGDGDLDAFITARDANDLVWLRNDGFQANWVADTIFPEANAPLGVAAGDIDGDGDMDAILCSWNDDKIYGFKNDGTGTFTPLVVDANIDAPREVKLADLDEDGDLDIALASTSSTNSVAWYANNGDGTMFSRQIIHTSGSCYDLDLGDWDQNGKLDILAAFGDANAEGEADLIAFLQNDANLFVPDTLVAFEGITGSVKLEDMDLDGDLDVIWGKGFSIGSDDNVQLGINQNGKLQSTISFDNSRTRSNVFGIATGDVDGNGKPDVVYADGFADELVLIKNVEITTSVSKSYLNSSISIFPNPSSGQITITSDAQASWDTVSIYDLNGKAVFHKKDVRASIQVDLEGLPAGMYVCRVQGGTQVVSRKFVLQ